MNDRTRVVASLMKGIAVVWPEGLDHETFLRMCDAQGATPLIAQQFRGRTSESGIPTSLAARLEAAGRVHLGHDVVRQRELDSLLDRFAAECVPVLVVKGAALARTHYAHPASRPRCDTDVFLERDAIAEGERILTEAGYVEEDHSGGEWISRQRTWVRIDTIGIRHSIDLHWALSNRQRYAGSLSFDELWSRGLPLHGAHIRMPCPVDALLLAAVHLAAHHRSHERLIWLYDIHLLHARMSAEDLQTLAARARERDIDMALDVALALAVYWFGDNRDATPPVRAGATAMSDLVEDLRFTRGLRPKLRLFREHLLPPGAYLLKKYGVTSRAALPALYLRRAIVASARLLRRYRAPRPD